MLEPISLSAVAVTGLGWVIGGALGNASDRQFCRAVRATRDRIAGLRGLPENHDVARAIRVAQLQALERLLADYEAAHAEEWKSPQRLWSGTGSDRPGIFLAHVQEFCAQGLGRCWDLSVELKLEVTKPLATTIDRILAGEHGGPAAEPLHSSEEGHPDAGSDASARDRMDATAEVVEDTVLNELQEVLAGRAKVPPDFEAHLRRGDGEHPPYVELFGAYLSEQIKEDERFQKILNTGQLAGIAVGVQELATRFGPVLKRVERRVKSIDTKQDLQLEYLEQILSSVQGSRGVPEAPFRRMLATLGEEGVPSERIPDRFRVLVEELVEARQQLATPPDSAVDLSDARREARELVDAGEFGRARELLASHRARARDARESRTREEAELLAHEARLDRLDLRYDDAIAKYAEAAELVAFDDDLRLDHLMDEARTLEALGHERGDNRALRKAASRYASAAAHSSLERDPVKWCRVRMGRADALAKLGAREKGLETLREAVELYRTILQDGPAADRIPPEQRARLRSHLGNALRILGERDTSAALLREAVTEYRGALDELERADAPVVRAKTQHNLASTLKSLGVREKGTAGLEAAREAYEEAVAFFTRDEYPREWALLRCSLGNVLTELGMREAEPHHFLEAVTEFETGLTGIRRALFPLDWALLQHNLGHTLVRLGEREPHGRSLQRGVTAYGRALEERTRDRVPVRWAASIFGRGRGWILLGERQASEELLTRAVTQCEEALDELEYGGHARLWAEGQRIAGTALLALGRTLGDLQLLRRAERRCRRALDASPRSSLPIFWAGCQADLGRVLLAIAAQTGDGEAASEARTAFAAALEELSGCEGHFDPASVRARLEQASEIT